MHNYQYIYIYRLDWPLKNNFLRRPFDENTLGFLKSKQHVPQDDLSYLHYITFILYIWADFAYRRRQRLISRSTPFITIYLDSWVIKFPHHQTKQTINLDRTDKN